jgi:hypothetical protein
MKGLESKSFHDWQNASGGGGKNPGSGKTYLSRTGMVVTVSRTSFLLSIGSQQVL